MLAGHSQPNSSEVRRDRRGEVGCIPSLTCRKRRHQSTINRRWRHL